MKKKIKILTKTQIAKKLKMSRVTLDDRLKKNNWKEKEKTILRKLKLL